MKIFCLSETFHWITLFVDETPIRVLTNTDYANNFFPKTKPMYLFSSIWCGDTWATEGGLVKTNWTYAPFVSYYTDFYVDACEWVEPSPACLSTTTQNWWDQSGAWQLTASQQEDYNWVQKNFLVYYYCLDTVRYPSPTMPEECSSNTIQYGNQYYWWSRKNERDSSMLFCSLIFCCLLFFLFIYKYIYIYAAYIGLILVLDLLNNFPC